MYTDILNYYERPATHFPVTLALLKLLENAFRCPGFVNQPKALAEVELYNFLLFSKIHSTILLRRMFQGVLVLDIISEEILKLNVQGASVLLYILRDVFRGIQKWRFEQPEVKLKMCKLILKIIVLALKQCDTLQVFYFKSIKCKFGFLFISDAD